MNFETVKKVLSKGNGNILSPGVATQVEVISKVMIEDLELSPPSQLASEDRVFEALTAVSDAFMSKGFDKNGEAVIEAFVLLTYNWNENVYKSDILGTFARSMKKLIDSYKVNRKVFRVMRETLIRDMSLKNWVQPSINITKEYLSQLLEETNNGNGF
jgi:hypothetical protein